MSRLEVIKIIKRLVNKLYDDDQYLFESEVCERCLMFRLAHYLQTEFSEYFIDCEFNKLGFNEHKHFDKVILNLKGNLKNMYADIIVHKRNSKIKDNFICLEIKRTKRWLDNDLVRLGYMTRRGGFVYGDMRYVYSYDLGVSLYLPKNKDKSEIRIFEDGKETSRINLTL